MSLSPASLSRVLSQHQSLDVLIGGLSADQFQVTVIDNKWTIHENIAHLTSYQPVFLGRITSILESDSPAFGTYKADDDPDFPHYIQKTTGQLLAQLKSDRQIIAQKLMSLTDPELARAGVHPTFGRMDLVWWTEFFLLHEAHHIFTIFRLLRLGPLRQ